MDETELYKQIGEFLNRSPLCALLELIVDVCEGEQSLWETRAKDLREIIKRLG